MDDIHDFIERTVGGDVRDPYAAFARKRRAQPVSHEKGFGGEMIYSVLSYAAVSAALKDADTYSSRVYGPAIGMVLGPSILQMDGLTHLSHRQLIGGSFRRTAVEGQIDPLIEPTVHQLIDGFVGRGEAELVRDFTFRFPVRIIAKLLGIPSEDYDLFARLSIELIGIATNIELGLKASSALGDYFLSLVKERRARPRDDMVTQLAHAEIDGEALPDDEILGFLRLLLPAGVETTYRLLGNLLFGLLSDPDQLAEVDADRALIAPAIEEALRWEAPVQSVSRETTRDAELAGVPIPAGSHVSLSIGSANRDDTVFDDPDRFDVRRKGAQHLAFADGPHRCLGEHLARVETTVAVNGLLDRLRDIRLTPGAWDPHVRGVPFRSPNAIPVAFTSA